MFHVCLWPRRSPNTHQSSAAEPNINRGDARTETPPLNGHSTFTCCFTQALAQFKKKKKKTTLNASICQTNKQKNPSLSVFQMSPPRSRILWSFSKKLLRGVSKFSDGSAELWRFKDACASSDSDDSKTRRKRDLFKRGAPFDGR